MVKRTHPVLCGGTFLSLVLESRKPSASRRQRTQGQTDAFLESDVFASLIKIVWPDYPIPAGETFKTYTTNYKQCKDYTPRDLQFDDPIIQSAFEERLKTDRPKIVNSMVDIIDRYIDMGTKTNSGELPVKRLLELIRDDDSISVSESFSVCSDGTTVTRKELPNITTIHFPSFLLSVWHYIIKKQIDNSLGVDTIAAWHSGKNNRNSFSDGSTIEHRILVSCEHIEVPDATIETDNESNETADDLFDEPVYSQDDPFAKQQEPRLTTNQIIVNQNVIQNGGLNIGFVGTLVNGKGGKNER